MKAGMVKESKSTPIVREERLVYEVKDKELTDVAAAYVRARTEADRRVERELESDQPG